MTRERPPDKYVAGAAMWYVVCARCKDRMLSPYPSNSPRFCDNCGEQGRPGFGGGNVAKTRADQQYHGGYHE